MTQNRARSKAIRARMDVTGEPYTVAARRHDEERAALAAGRGDEIRVHVEAGQPAAFPPDAAEEYVAQRAAGRDPTAGRPRGAVWPGDPDWVDGFGPVPGSGLA